jgi:ABC-2 type transport system ATP-binding protein
MGAIMSLVAENISIAYGAKTLFANFSRTFDYGVHAIVGANGSGKTSLLSCLAGIVKPRAGRVSVDGIDLYARPVEAKRRLSFMPDKPLVYPFMTGNELLRIVASVKNDVVDEQVIESLNLGRHVDTTFRSMSFGTQRKFTLVAALIGNPRVLLMDEPLNGLDKDSKEQFVRVINEYRSTRVILFATHDPELIERTHAAEMHL